MIRPVFAIALGLVFCVAGTVQSAVYDNVYWVGGDGEWTGDVTATPSYSTGNWSTDPNAVSGVPAKYALGRNDGIRVGEAVGAGGYDHDRIPDETLPGIQLGTDVYIANGATVTYNPNRQILPEDTRPIPDNEDRFGDFRFSPNAAFPGTPTLNLSNGSTFVHKTTLGGDTDGMWTRWNGAALNIDNATFSRSGDEANGFAGGAWMFASFHGYENSEQTVSITNGGRFENHGQAWFGQSDIHVEDGGNQPGISVIMTINDGHVDLTGGDEYGLDNDGLPLRADLAFIYHWTHDDDPLVPETFENNETYIINFTGPGTITVDGQDANPLDTPEVGAGRGGIRVAHTLASGIVDIGETDPNHIGHTLTDFGTDGDTQRSYGDLWDLGILRAHNKSGLTGDTFSEFFSVINNPGDNDYMLTSLVVPATGTTGDYNEDGIVNAADYAVWRDNVGATDTLGNDDIGGLIGTAHYDQWVSNFGNTFGGSGSSAAIPEPSSVALALTVLLAGLAVRRSRG